MSMLSMCSSRFAASLAWVPRTAFLSGVGIHRPSCARPLARPGHFGQGERLYGKDSKSYNEISPVLAFASKRKKRPNSIDRWTPGLKKKNDQPPLNGRQPSPSSTTTTLKNKNDVSVRQPPVSTIPFVGEEPAKWEGFAAKVSGEWEGGGVEFNLFGEPRELPKVFRQGEEKVYDWQTQCPTVAHPENGRLWYNVIKLNPRVGGEADAAAVEERDASKDAPAVPFHILALAAHGAVVEDRDASKDPAAVERDASKDASALAFHSSGSYTALWPGKFFTNKKMVSEDEEVEVEQCFVHGKTRVRVFQKLGRRRHVFLFRESLGGGSTAAFATDSKSRSNIIFGQWNSDIYTLQNPQPEQGYASSELVHTGSEVVERNWSSTFLYGWFSKDTWTLLMKTESGTTTIETGWLAEPDLMMVTLCEVGTSGNLKDVSFRVEKRVSSEVAPLNVSAEELEEMLTE